jgi:rod shape-determining protein MreD
MRWLWSPIFLVVLLVLQTVIFPRFPLLGETPDLFLISVIIIAVYREQREATLLAALYGFCQDLLSAGGYFNLAAKVAAVTLVSAWSAEAVGDRRQMAWFLTGILTPLQLLAFWSIGLVLGEPGPTLTVLLGKALLITAYNLILFFPLEAVLKRIYGER